VEDFTLTEGADAFDLAFACRVGALDGRHGELFAPAMEQIRKALAPGSSLYVDTGTPLTEIRPV